MENVPRTPKTPPASIFYARRDRDRRKKKSEGYINLGIVGWYCRRERVRREGDEFLPNESGPAED